MSVRSQLTQRGETNHADSMYEEGHPDPGSHRSCRRVVGLVVEEGCSRGDSVVGVRGPVQAGRREIPGPPGREQGTSGSARWSPAGRARLGGLAGFRVAPEVVGPQAGLPESSRSVPWLTEPSQGGN